jgi:hypothetical protein
MTTGFVTANLNVTVHLDATYAIDAVRGPVCSGVGELPAGTACPLKDDLAIADCFSSLKTFNGAECVASVDATCVVVAESTWGCVFLDVQGEDLTSTLTISSELASDASPWGDLPWRAPPPLDSEAKVGGVGISSELQME